ncbi:hypothetical protein [Pontibacter roseus]|uniref:hypothetical protein n=1 Tax=Pontibacter roseus TaxID=336989 RepID=UPI0003632692|nr:hypothetical protein [Pontibacter roseus]
MSLRVPSGYTLLLFGFLTACGSGTSEHTVSATDAVQQLCFLQVTKGKPTFSGPDTLPGVIDSLRIHLTINGSHVTGELDWLPAEKDRMTGTLDGTMQDSTIIAVYTYTAKGTRAREERIFRLTPDAIQMKAGELVERDGIWVLQDKDAAPFSTTAARVACP